MIIAGCHFCMVVVTNERVFSQMYFWNDTFQLMCKLCFEYIGINPPPPPTHTHIPRTSDIRLCWSFTMLCGSNYRETHRSQRTYIALWWTQYEPLVRIIWDIIPLHISDLPLCRWHPLCFANRNMMNITISWIS